MHTCIHDPFNTRGFTFVYSAYLYRRKFRFNTTVSETRYIFSILVQLYYCSLWRVLNIARSDEVVCVNCKL